MINKIESINFNSIPMCDINPIVGSTSTPFIVLSVPKGIFKVFNNFETWTGTNCCPGLPASIVWGATKLKYKW